MKLMKQMKFWSRKKKRMKSLGYQRLDNNDHYYNYYTHLNYNPPPPPPRPPPPRPPQVSQLCRCHFCEPAEPSAPPLPPWLELSHDTYLGKLGSDEEHCISISEEMTDAGTRLKSDEYDSTPILDSREPVISSLGQLGSGEEHCISVSEEMTDAGTLLKSGECDMTQILECPEPDTSSEELCISISEEMTDTRTLLESGKNDLIPIQGFGEPVKSKRQQGSSRNVFGCVFDIGALLLRCFSPCFGLSAQRDCHYSGPSIKALPSADTGKKGVVV